MELTEEIILDLAINRSLYCRENHYLSDQCSRLVLIDLDDVQSANMVMDLHEELSWRNNSPWIQQRNDESLGKLG